MTALDKAPKVFDFLDYRQYLSAWMAWQKQCKTSFSLRLFTQRIGLSSASFLSAVLKGKKNLGEEVRLKLGASLGLSSDEEEYFHWLVQFNQTKEMEGKNYCFRQLQKFRASKAYIVGEGQYLFYSQWYYSAVWNWFGLNPKERSPAQIAKAIRPALTASQVEESILVLQQCGLLRKVANGYQTSETHLTTAPEVASLAVKNHILDIHHLATQMLDQVPAEQRQYNTLMFQVSANGFATIKDRIRLFQEELRDILDHDHGEDRIYTLAMSLFPNSQVKDP